MPHLRLPQAALALAVLALLLAGPALALTYVTENIQDDTTWNVAGSPYVIQADILVGNGAVLTIDPGTTVAFDGDYELRVGWHSEVFAIGLPGQRVLFTSNADHPAMSDWDRLIIDGPDLSSFSYCTFEYADVGLYLNYTDPPISYCDFRQCRMGIACIASSSPISNCNIFDGQQGIFITNNLSRPTIHGCNLYNHTGWNVHVQLYPAPDVMIDAQNNWWGVTDAAGIAATIHDHEDDDRLRATIDFAPWLGAMPVTEATWGGVKARFR